MCLNFSHNSLGKINSFLMKNISNFLRNWKKLDECLAAGEKAFWKRKLPLNKWEKNSSFGRTPGYHHSTYSYHRQSWHWRSSHRRSSWHSPHEAHRHSRAKSHPFHYPSNTLRIVSHLGHQKSASFLHQFLFFWKDYFPHSYARLA